MPRAYFVVSDLHLCDIEEHDDGWKAYKSARYVVDAELAQAVNAFLLRAPDDDCTVVLNGDIIDFDLVTRAPDDPPWPVSLAERRRGMDATEAKSAWKLERVLADHPEFVAMLAHVLAAGHRVVYVLGNHDREMHFESVQKAFRDAVTSVAEGEGITIDQSLLIFEPWFFYAPGEVYVEHGQQYDYYNSFRYILEPTIPGLREPAIALPMGNLSNRELMSEMGFFNPHASDYILNVYSYVLHWLRHYAFTRRNIMTRWLLGSIVVLFKLLRTKGAVQRHPPNHAAALQQMAARIDMPLEQLQALERLKRLPITNRWYRVIREFWIDRLILAALMTGGTIALALVPIPLWIKLMVPLSSFPLLYLIYEWFAHGETVFSAERQAGKYALEIANIIDCRVVTFGHSHKPLTLPVAPGVTYVNTGTWAPVWGRGEETRRLSPGLCNVLELRFDERVEISLSSTARAVKTRDAQRSSAS